jgi:hypothetical protein
MKKRRRRSEWRRRVRRGDDAEEDDEEDGRGMRTTTTTKKTNQKRKKKKTQSNASRTSHQQLEKTSASSGTGWPLARVKVTKTREAMHDDASMAVKNWTQNSEKKKRMIPRRRFYAVFWF